MRVAAPLHTTGAVEFVSLEDVVPDEMFRLRPDGDVSVLATSLGRLGQFVPVELRPWPGAGYERPRWQVVAGFRRLAAVRLLARERVLARLHAELSDEDAWALALADALLQQPLSGPELRALKDRLRASGVAPWAEELVDEALVRAPVEEELRERFYDFLTRTDSTTGESPSVEAAACRAPGSVAEFASGASAALATTSDAATSTGTAAGPATETETGTETEAGTQTETGSGAETGPEIPTENGPGTPSATPIAAPTTTAIETVTEAGTAIAAQAAIPRIAPHPATAIAMTASSSSIPLLTESLTCADSESARATGVEVVPVELGEPVSGVSPAPSAPPPADASGPPSPTSDAEAPLEPPAVELTCDELARDVTTRFSQLDQDLALLYENWSDVPPEERRALVEQARYVAELLPFMEKGL